MSEKFSHHRRRLGTVVLNSRSKGTALITGASAGIGAVYADRLAHRGYDLILVARNRDRLEALATRITKETGRAIEVLVADLNVQSDLDAVERVLRTDSTITMLVNNAGIGSTAPLLDANIDTMVEMIDLNVTALTRLTQAVMPAFVKRDSGTIINVGSVVGLAPEVLIGAVYGGTKAFVLGFSLSLQKELAGSKIRVQAVLPGATATGFWDVAGTPLDRLPSQIVMTTADLVDAALVGLDLGELVTIPALPDVAEWDAYEEARQRMMSKLSLSSPAERYSVTSSPVPQH